MLRILVEVEGGGCFLVFFLTLTPTLKFLAAHLLHAKFSAAHLLHGVDYGSTPYDAFFGFFLEDNPTTFAPSTVTLLQCFLPGVTLAPVPPPLNLAPFWQMLAVWIGFVDKGTS